LRKIEKDQKKLKIDWFLWMKSSETVKAMYVPRLFQSYVYKNDAPACWLTQAFSQDALQLGRSSQIQDLN
jgi:hypothetical protein